jgi:hypothetical protein
MVRHAKALVLVLIVGFIGCGDDSHPPPVTDSALIADAGADAALTDMGGDMAQGDAATAGFAGTVQPIFTASCAGGNCHGGSTPKAGLELVASKAYAALVGVASTNCSNLKRVEAGAPDKSFLVQKVEGAGSCFKGQKMPIGGGSLTTAQIDAIKAWITAGAKKD